MQGLFEVVACLSVVAPLTGIVGPGSPSKVAAQQFQSEGGQLDEKIQFSSK